MKFTRRLKPKKFRGIHFRLGLPLFPVRQSKPVRSHPARMNLILGNGQKRRALWFFDGPKSRHTRYLFWIRTPKDGVEP
jgi:hypothetical protein